ncbi:MAG: hypothetical protein KDA85_21930, partial [Planctomycetaceae bacterium]|nr:hypothetical protein [Planctomycetaceae bacterium]
MKRPSVAIRQLIAVLILACANLVTADENSPQNPVAAFPAEVTVAESPDPVPAADEPAASTEAQTAAEQPPAPVASDVAEPAGEACAEPTGESTAAQQRYLLKYQFQPGQKLRYQTHQIMTQEAHVGENSKIDVSKVDQQRVYTVQEINDDGTAVIRMQFAHVRMQIQTDDKPAIVFDSGMPPEDVPKLYQAAAHQLRGLSPTFYILSNGRAVHGPAPHDAAGNEILSKEEEEKRSHEAESFLPPLPEEPIAIGDTWKHYATVSVRVDKDIRRDVRILQTYRLSSVEDNVAVFTSQASIMSQLRSPVVMAQLLQVTPRGTYKLDLNSGVLTFQELRHSQTVLGALGPSSAINAYGTYSNTLMEDKSQS